MILPIVGMSQAENPWKTFVQTNLFIEWSKYLTDCNELVPDTIRQSGTVKCELVPVRLNGKIVSYNTVPIDTVWNKCDCDEYKNRGYVFSDNSNSWISGNITNTGTLSGIYHLSEPESAKNTFAIKRNKICQIKKRKATFEDFFERWCVEQKLIKLN